MEAAGHFSSVKKPAPDDIAHLNAYLDPNMTRWTRQIILTGQRPQVSSPQLPIVGRWS
jgi:hypothetical protein